MSSSKSYWQEAYIGNDKAKENIRSWFGFMSEGMMPYKAEILCDIATDREKKIRAFMTDADDNKFVFERTLGRRFSISRKPIEGSRAVSEGAS